MDNYVDGECYKCGADLMDDFGIIVCVGCAQEQADCDCDA